MRHGREVVPVPTAMPRCSRRTAVFFVVALVAFITARPAWAHHILGIPHYAYEEDYPQAPVLTYRMQAGPYEVKMTGYPGMPVPGESSSLHVYIKRSDNGRLFDGEVRLTVTEDRMIGEDPIVYGPIEVSLDERIYKFYPLFKHEANYTAQIEFEADGVPWRIDLPIVVGEPGSPWVVVGATGGGALLFVLFIRAIRIKMLRKRRMAIRETKAQEVLS